MANENQPGLPPQHLSSQTVPQGNQTATTNSAPIEKQLLELQRREKEVRKLQESLKGSVPLDSLKERAKSDRNGLLRELGLDDLIQEDENDPIVNMRKQIEEMRNAQALKEREAEEARELEALRAQLREKPEDYELVGALGYEDKVYEAIKRHKAEHGEMPDAYEIAKRLEDAILSDVSSLKGSKKLADIFKQESAPAPQRHPLDSNSTITSSDRTSTQQAEPMTPTMSRHQQIEQISKHIKFND